VKTAVVLSTGSEIIELAPVVKEMERKGVNFFILHTGQHYSYTMNRVFFKLPTPSITPGRQPRCAPT